MEGQRLPPHTLHICRIMLELPFSGTTPTGAVVFRRLCGSRAEREKEEMRKDKEDPRCRGADGAPGDHSSLTGSVARTWQAKRPCSHPSTRSHHVHHRRSRFFQLARQPAQLVRRRTQLSASPRRRGLRLSHSLHTHNVCGRLRYTLLNDDNVIDTCPTLAFSCGATCNTLLRIIQSSLNR